jgi:hypothetical protein
MYLLMESHGWQTDNGKCEGWQGKITGDGGRGILVESDGTDIDCVGEAAAPAHEDPFTEGRDMELVGMDIVVSQNDVLQLVDFEGGFTYGFFLCGRICID